MMKKNHIKKIILGITLMSLFSMIVFTAPEKAAAQWAVTDVGDTIQNTLSAIENSATAAATTGQQIQNTVLDKIATALAKQLLMQVTASVINWINSGFNGNPSFIQNPTAFFENVGDQATGQFISQNGELSSLCSPFSLQVRLAIAFQQQQNDGLTQGKYACTLSTIIKNDTNAVKNASVQGFISGDFNQGGFSAFATLTTQPQNNPNGAYIIAEDELQQKINAQTAQKQNELNQGQGFLSWESCTPNSSVNNTATSSDDDYSDGFSDDPYNTGKENDPNQTCTVQTPGSVISSALNKHLAVPTENLELANSINDIINAAFSEIVVKTLQGGLTSISKSQNGGPSYLQSSIGAATQQSFSGSQQQLITTITPYLSTAKTISMNYSQALNLALAASSSISQAESCYQALENSPEDSAYTLANTYIEGQINDLQNDATNILPLTETIISQSATASTTAGQYQQMYNEVVSAQSLSDLNTPNQLLTTIAQNGGFPTQADIQRSQADLTSAQNSIQPIEDKANTALAQCQSFDFSTYELMH